MQKSSRPRRLACSRFWGSLRLLGCSNRFPPRPPPASTAFFFCVRQHCARGATLSGEGRRHNKRRSKNRQDSKKKKQHQIGPSIGARGGRKHLRKCLFASWVNVAPKQRAVADPREWLGGSFFSLSWSLPHLLPHLPQLAFLPPSASLCKSDRSHVVL